MIARFLCWLGFHRLGMLRHVSDGHFARTCLRMHGDRPCEHTEWQDVNHTYPSGDAPRW